MTSFQQGLGKLLGRLLTLSYLPQPLGAYNSLFAATSPIVKERHQDFAGAYLTPVGKITKPGGGGDNAETARDCWETSERAILAM